MGDRYDDPGWHRGGDMGSYMDSGGGLVMVILMAAFLAVIVALVYLLVRSHECGYAHGPAPRGEIPARSQAESELDQRFARGEIDEAEYLQRRTVLRSG